MWWTAARRSFDHAALITQYRSPSFWQEVKGSLPILFWMVYFPPFVCHNTNKGALLLTALPSLQLLFKELVDRSHYRGRPARLPLCLYCSSSPLLSILLTKYAL